MSVTIATKSTTSHPGIYANAKHMDRSTKGVLWAAIPNRAASPQRLEFWFSTNNGASWTEDTSERISDIDLFVGTSFVISADRAAVIYRQASTNLMRVAFSFVDSGSSPHLNWRATHKDASKGQAKTEWFRPDIELIKIGGWYVTPCVWGRLTSTDWSSVWLGRVRWQEGEDVQYAGDIQRLHTRENMSTFPRPSCALRHLGDDTEANTSQPDLYVGWGQGIDTDAQDRLYMQRNELSGWDWQPGQTRVVEEDGAASGLVASCYTGQRYAMVAAPTGASSTLVLWLMTPSDTGARERYAVPALGLGEMTSVAITWDNATADIWIIACGTTNRRPHWIRLNWATRTWTSWTEINTDDVLGDTLQAVPGSKASRIEIMYAVVAASTTFKYELVALTNVPPKAPTWETSQGVHNTAAALLLDWNHNDPDGDAQVQYELRRRIGDGALMYWNGTSWQTTLVQPSSATSSVSLGGGWAASGDTVTYTVRTNDGQDWGPFSEALTVLGSTAVDPTITFPTAATITAARITATWMVAEQSAYRWRVLLTATSELLHDSGWVGDPAARFHTLDYSFQNGVDYTLELTTQNNEGLVSAPQTKLVTAALAPPPDPAVALAANFTGIFAAIDVAVTNGTPGGGEEAAVLNYAYRRRTADPLAEEVLVSPTGFDPDTTFTDHTAPSGVDVSYRVEAETAERVRASSPVVTDFA